MSERIIDTRWQSVPTGEVIRVTGTNTTRTYHQTVNEDTRYTGAVLDLELRDESLWRPLGLADDAEDTDTQDDAPEAPTGQQAPDEDGDEPDQDHTTE